MYAKIMTGALFGMESDIIAVESDLSSGLPGIALVGLPDASVREAKERIRTAIANAGYRFPPKRITINLAPADSRKEGTHFDLPIAASILEAAGNWEQGAFSEYAMVGELSLDGRINGIRGALPLAIGLRSCGIRKMILPLENADEVSLLDDVELYPLIHLSEVETLACNGHLIAPYSRPPRKAPADQMETAGDFADVYGQQGAKRALQIAAAAAHNLLMVGPPGAGKTMMARRLPGILPPLSYEEQLEVTKIYSIAGELPRGRGMLRERPFRAPHHTSSVAAMTGGGGKPKPGEISLAHSGVLFLDELPEFRRSVLEVLRQPLEDRRITLARASATVEYPASILLIAAMNPCPCGYLGDPFKRCSCTEYQIQQYRSRISGPLLDRIDIKIDVFPPAYEAFRWNETKQTTQPDSAAMKAEVLKAREIQLQRYREESVLWNSELAPDLIKKYCRPDKAGQEILKQADAVYRFSARAQHKILRLSRTIADLEGTETITSRHIAEAIGYRCLETRMTQ